MPLSTCRVKQKPSLADKILHAGAGRGCSLIAEVLLGVWQSSLFKKMETALGKCDRHHPCDQTASFRPEAAPMTLDWFAVMTVHLLQCTVFISLPPPPGHNRSTALFSPHCS